VFQGRPDDLGPYASAKLSPAEHPGDDPLVANGVAGESGATNLGPHSAELKAYTKELIAYWHKRGVQPTSDLVTTSGSGIDPDITPADAVAEIPMVSRATGLSSAVLTRLINQQTNGAELGFLGSPYITVLQLNEALVKLEK
jgi:K+-transporting ATPase ATPase C chain